jgi:hypothetical protein
MTFRTFICLPPSRLSPDVSSGVTQQPSTMSREGVVITKNFLKFETTSVPSLKFALIQEFSIFCPCWPHCTPTLLEEEAMTGLAHQMGHITLLSYAA